jgi:hypothetical protein
MGVNETGKQILSPGIDSTMGRRVGSRFKNSGHTLTTYSHIS